MQKRAEAEEALKQYVSFSRIIHSSYSCIKSKQHDNVTEQCLLNNISLLKKRLLKCDGWASNEVAADCMLSRKLMNMKERTELARPKQCHYCQTLFTTWYQLTVLHIIVGETDQNESRVMKSSLLQN